MTAESEHEVAVRAATRLRGRILILARAAWVAIALLVVAFFVAGEFLYTEELRTAVCEEGVEVCAGEALLTPENVRELENLGLSAGFYAVFDIAINAVFVSVWLGVGAVVFWRRSDDRMALLVAFFLATFGPASFGPFAPEFLAGEYPALWLPVKGVQFIGETCLALFFCLFPSGRFVPGWTRPLLLAFLVALTPVVFLPGSPLDWIGRLGLPGTVALAPFYAGFVAAQVFRYRRVSGPVERQQTKWVVFGAAAALGGLVGLSALSAALGLPSDEYSMTFSLFASWSVAYMLMLLIPLSIGFAVLRTRLFDVDVLINRALVYVLLTASLVVVYLGAVVLLQYAFRGFVGETSQLAVVVSTLVIAALFSPLRSRIQALIDRRFYRQKYDARETLEAFSAALRDETDLDALGNDLTVVVRETIRPEHVSLWLRGPEDGARR